VLFLDGKVAAVRQAFIGMENDEREYERRNGPRSSPWTVFFIINRAWLAFDQNAARVVGPKVRDMSSAVARLAELASPVTAGQYSSTEASQFRQLWTRGQNLSREAEQLLSRWTASPPSLYDRQNVGLLQAAVRLMMITTPGVSALLSAVGTTTGQAARAVTGGVSTAAATLTPAETIRGTAPDTAPVQEQMPTNWLVIGATVVLVGALGYLGYRVVKDVVMSPSPAEAKLTAPDESESEA